MIVISRWPHRLRALVVAALVPLGCGVLACGCGQPSSPPTAARPSGPGVDGNSEPTRQTIDANAKAAAALPPDDGKDFDDARQGFIADDANLEVRGSDPSAPPIWKRSDYAFVDGSAPSSVNPGLWRQARLNGIGGLFRVAEGVYQVRGYDLSNLSLIRGKTGWIVVDPLTCKETAAAALALARKHLGTDPIVAVIFTHSHVDHFGGIAAVLADPYSDAKKLRVIAPRGFVEEATSENVLAGIAMGRRATFMYGSALSRSERGHVDTGLGKAPAIGSISIIEPTELIDSTTSDLVIDGVPFRFQYVPESEAPAEAAFYLPDSKAYCGAEIVTHTLHNLYTLRGAKVRDALRWSGYIDQAIKLFPDLDVVFASHHWPTFGKERAVAFLERQRDVYKYIHDQTLRLANQGLGPRQIAEQLELPASLKVAFSERGYYGTVRHNAKAVYQAYFGWYDGNPANLDPLPPVEEATHYVDEMGGADAVLKRAGESFDRGDYRWTATLLNDLVFADSGNQAARDLLARTYDQLGYQAESGPWRDEYLTGAFELRHGTQPSALRPSAAGDLLRHLTPSRFFDAMAVRLDAPKAEGKTLAINFVFTDVGETHVVKVQNSVLHHEKTATEGDPAASATIHLSREFLVRLSIGEAGLREMIFSNELTVDGSRLDVLAFFSLLDKPDGKFAIVTP
ncbi:MAG TPA: alkyl sulfatase dimerization domain-containing protein [Candidatus Binatia bacterium]|jgi:alkyl sulfatase BDS1-like metallo-beta-lactamase superfamily hydrolase